MQGGQQVEYLSMEERVGSDKSLSIICFVALLNYRYEESKHIKIPPLLWLFVLLPHGRILQKPSM